jgi:Helix-turn-helix domain
MARKDQAAQLLREGHTPSQIASQMGTSPASVMQYLCLKIGEGELRRSDIAFSLSGEIRNAIEEAIEKTGSTSLGAISRALRKRGISANRVDVGIYLHYRGARAMLGDMYELVRAVEVRLHSFIKHAFITEFGEEQWWRSGVPDSIRADCAALLEKDPEPANEPYCYTHLINLREIADKRWPILAKYMPKHLHNEKKELLERLTKLNRIRNSVMHPVRNAALDEDAFEFVRELEADLADLRVHNPADTEPTAITEVVEAAEQGSQPHELVAAITDPAPVSPPTEEEVA